MEKKVEIAAIGIFITVFILACNATSLGLTTPATETPSPTATTTLSFLPAPTTEVPQVQASPTVTVQPVDAPVDPICVSRSENSPAPDFSVFANLGNEIMLALNNGVPSAELERALVEQGYAIETDAVTLADLTGDGKYELILSVIDPQSTTITPAGNFMIFNCSNGLYQAGFVQRSRENESMLQTRLIRDLDSDGAQELLASASACGAHTCFENYQLLVWNGQTYQNRLVGDTTDLPFPEVQVSDPEGDGYLEIEIVGTGIGSVGAGPPRRFIRQWANNPETENWEVVEEYYGQSNYRIHVLHDADMNFRAENYDVARALYTDAIENDSLEDWVDPELERRAITGYAEYKILLIHLIQTNPAEAESHLQQMQMKYEENTAGTYLGAMEILYDTYLESGLGTACTAVRSYAEQNHATLIAPLGTEHFGYGNPEITLADLCP